jgi:hypothetical protein
VGFKIVIGRRSDPARSISGADRFPPRGGGRANQARGILALSIHLLKLFQQPRLPEFLGISEVNLHTFTINLLIL